ncbi:N-acetyltransferase [Thalassotalea euphylliae]|uniref:N-acetyltransferase n=1 Tax=Thalassotalea euphylliae TaxID=1655234 RepID=A0A3E0TP93_9GAMM|nr:GNAT family N-acetyltransferase [Thalassotalea euphylliae]REL26344.1 N-acetyltransferase [Thalassotalea euphylliae]
MPSKPVNYCAVDLSASQAFETDRFIIRPMQESERDFFISLHIDENIMKYTGGAVSEKTANAKFNNSIKLNQSEKITFKTWTIVAKENRQAIGIQVLYQPQQVMEPFTREIGIMIAKSSQGRLIPEEAMGALMEYAFSELSITRIIARFSVENIATKRFVKKLGFLFNKQPTSGSYSVYFDKMHWKQSIITLVN